MHIPVSEKSSDYTFCTNCGEIYRFVWAYYWMYNIINKIWLSKIKRRSRIGQMYYQYTIAHLILINEVCID